jgi:succinate dehydrogenase / fumarate reductase iron-sulfur subunit
MIAPAPGSTRTVRIRIRRQDSPQGAPYWEEYAMPYRPNQNIITVLQWCAANSRTTDGRDVAPVTWDAACLEEVCGSCTMNINGRVRQACSALLDPILAAAGEDVVSIEPMNKFPVVRDLVVNRQRMFDNLIRIKGWVPIDGTHSLGGGPKEAPAEQETRYALSRCMTCGCCLEACPQFTIDNEFVGAQVIGQVQYFNMHKTGKVLKDQRLDVMEAPGGIADCGNAQNCVKVCPKEIPLTEAIGAVGRQTTVHAIKKFFTGK